MDIGFALNYQHVIEINVTPGAAEPVWAWLGPGIKTITPEKSETTSEDAYYDGGGQSEIAVSGMSRSWVAEGSRRYGDPAQDFIASLDDAIGEDLVTQMRMTNPDGEVIESDVTVHEIAAKGPNGDANSRATFSCRLTRKGMPRLVSEAVGTSLPESLSVSDVTAAVGAKTPVTATVEPATASPKCLFAVEDPGVATVDSEGNVTGAKPGLTRLTVKCAAKPSVGKTVKVTVTAAAK